MTRLPHTQSCRPTRWDCATYLLLSLSRGSPSPLLLPPPTLRPAHKLGPHVIQNTTSPHRRLRSPGGTDLAGWASGRWLGIPSTAQSSSERMNKPQHLRQCLCAALLRPRPHQNPTRGFLGEKPRSPTPPLPVSPPLKLHFYFYSPTSPYIAPSGALPCRSAVEFCSPRTSGSPRPRT